MFKFQWILRRNARWRHTDVSIARSSSRLKVKNLNLWRQLPVESSRTAAKMGEEKTYYSSETSTPAIGPCSPLRNVYRGFPSGVQWAGQESNKTQPSNVDVKKGWNYTSTPLYDYMMYTGTNAQFTLPFNLAPLLSVQKLLHAQNSQTATQNTKFQASAAK